MTGHRDITLPLGVTAAVVMERRTELATLSGPQLAALTFPAPTDIEREALTTFLAHYHGAPNTSKAER